MKRINILISAIALAALVACSSGSNKGVADTSANSADKKEMVKVMALEMQTIARTVEYTATLQAFEEIHLVPASPGRIQSIYAEVGDRVSAGALLVQMDKTQLHNAEIQLKSLETDYKRLDTLQKVGSIAQQQYDQIKTQYQIARSNYEFLSENTRLKAPFSGVISGRYFEAGEMYSGAPNTAIGKAAILSIVQIGTLKAFVPVSEKYFPMLKTGMVASVVCDIYPGRAFTGKIFRIHPTIDAASRSFNVEVSIENREGILRPGMFSRVTLDLDSEQAIVLPAMAVLKMQGSNERYLFVEIDGKAKRIPAVIGKRYDDKVEVISDQLKEGDKIIVSGQARLLDGMAVQVVN